MKWTPSFLSRLSCCELCGDTGEYSSCLCQGCLDDLPYLIDACHRCGIPVPRDVTVCGHCTGALPAADCTITAFHYRYPVDALIKQFKYREKIRLAAPLVDVLANKILAHKQVLPDVLIPVPLHYYRLFRRGYNQAAVLSTQLGAQLGIKTDFSLVVRKRNTAPMFRLNAMQRRLNISGVFELRRACTNLNVAIVDDVITSGSTVAELARTLRRGGARQIQLWALARAD